MLAGAEGEDGAGLGEPHGQDADRGSTGDAAALLEVEEEDPEETAAVREHAEYIRLHKKPLQFGVAVHLIRDRRREVRGG